MIPGLGWLREGVATLIGTRDLVFLGDGDERSWIGNIEDTTVFPFMVDEEGAII